MPEDRFYDCAMASRQTINTEVDAETMAAVERVARRRGISNEQFVAEAVQRVAASDDDFDAFIQAGVDAIERGEVVPHEDVMAELDAMIAYHRARCA
jgi:predicted transcriptional regulator